MLSELLAQIPPDEAAANVSGGGAYDTQTCHVAIVQRSAQALISLYGYGKSWKTASLRASVC